ncbi:MAG: hypothetical protein ACODAE_07430 [Gemmatimonadota bacterium]
MKKRTAFLVGRRTRRSTTVVLIVTDRSAPALPGPWTICAVVSSN